MSYKNGPKVSVVLSTYSRNHGDKGCPNLLCRAIDSILAQTFEDFELILIDDCSRDGSELVCREYESKDSRVRYFRFNENSGKPAVRYNDGMKLARSDLFMFMFDDDMWLPNCIEDLYGAILRNPKCGMVYGLADFVDVRNNVESKSFGASWDYERLCSAGNFICNLSVIVRRDVINKVGGYDESPVLRRLCDWDLWVRIGKRYEVIRLEKTVGRCFHSQPDSIGLTINLSSDDLGQIRKIQSKERDVRLKGELEKRVKVCFVYKGHDEALRRWSIDYLSSGLRDEGFDSDSVDIRSDKGLCEGADVIVLYRLWDDESFEFAKEMKRKGKLVLYSIDDYLFQPNCLVTKEFIWKIPRFLEQADGVISPSLRLLDKVPQGKPKIHRKSSLDFEALDFLRSEKKKKGSFDIGWICGFNRHENDNFVLRVLEILEKRIGSLNGFRFHCFGKHGFGNFTKIGVYEHSYFAPEDWRGLYGKYKEIGFDVVISPLSEDDEFFHCKSELKYIESGALGVPLIVSRVSPFTEVIVEKENGLFASTPEEFAEKILFLYGNKEASRRIGREAQERVRREYNSTRTTREFVVSLLSMMSGLVVDSPREKSLPVFKVSKLGRGYEYFEIEGLSEDDGGIVGPIISGRHCEVDLPVDFPCEISVISVLGATYQKKLKGCVRVSVFVNDLEVRSGSIPHSQLIDNSWWKFEFDSICLSSGDTLTVRLDNRDPSGCIAFRTCKGNKGTARVGSRVVKPIAMKIGKISKES